MKSIVLFVIFIIGFSLCYVMPSHRHDEEEEMFMRKAYDTPSYDSFDHDEEEHDEDLIPGKKDIVKDALWALKAKLKQLKAYEKAVKANILADKHKIEEALKNHLSTLKKPLKLHIEEIHTEKPYNCEGYGTHTGYSHYGQQYPSHYRPEYGSYHRPSYGYEPNYQDPYPERQEHYRRDHHEP